MWTLVVIWIYIFNLAKSGGWLNGWNNCHQNAFGDMGLCPINQIGPLLQFLSNLPKVMIIASKSDFWICFNFEGLTWYYMKVHMMKNNFPIWSIQSKSWAEGRGQANLNFPRKIHFHFESEMLVLSNLSLNIAFFKSQRKK